MQPFQFVQPKSLDEALSHRSDSTAMWLAGGTTLVDLMKINVLTPSEVISIAPVLDKSIKQQESNIIIGAGCTMAQVASEPLIIKHLPVVRQALILAASPQIRNMATLGGNLLQRTRSAYYRHIDFPQAAAQRKLESDNDEADHSSMAMLGHNGRMLGTYPGDFGIALVALAGQLHLRSRDAQRVVPARDFFRVPTDQPTYSTALAQDEIIEAISIPISPSSEHSLYLKIRERSSYAFALVSAAVALQLQGSGKSAKIVEAKVGLGGLATVPWASPEAEQVLRGQPAADDVFQQAADAALASAQPPKGLEYKVVLAKRVLVRALQTLRDRGVPSDQEIWAFQHGRQA